MGPPISIETRMQIHHLLITKNLKAEEICASLPVKVSQEYMRRLCKKLRDPTFAAVYLEGARHSTGRPSTHDDDIEYFLNLQAQNVAFTIRKLHCR
jgi:hypothetical protein